MMLTAKQRTCSSGTFITKKYHVVRDVENKNKHSIGKCHGTPNLQFRITRREENVNGK